MKTTLFFIISLTAFSLLAQERGVTPLSAEASAKAGQTYAVVVGISDYQDPGIPDLNYAHRDAEAFANFLRSPAGGSLDDDHLKVLINEKATQAQFAAALDWLWEVAGEDDKAIIYFSGHGDVEKKSLTQPGFLLCWDAPSQIYMAGGAFPLSMMEEVITTISVQNKAKVIMIADACRAGKLSGSKVNGAQLTNSNLAKGFENVIKILSCQPDEYSIEGEQWGDGRGVFSYHLLDGLYGMADRNADQTVNLMEIRGYLEENVSTEVDPQRQLPMTIGSGREKLTDVFPDILAQLKEGKKGQLQLFTGTESRGIEDEVLAAADSNIVQMYFAFKQALEDKQFLFAEAGRAEHDYADYYYEKLAAEPGLERLHSSIRRNYAAALQDDAQQTLNDWMKTSEDQALEEESGARVVRLPRKVFTEKVRAFPACLERAAELLGSDHYMYATLQARKHFFDGYLLANSNYNPNKELGDRALAAFRQALDWQPEMPHAYWQMISVYGNNFLQSDSAEVYAKKAMDLYPSWLKPYTSLAGLLCSRYRQFDRAKPYLEQAMQIDSNSVFVLNLWGNYHWLQKEYSEAKKYYTKAIQIDSANYAPHSNLGVLYRDTRHYDEAEKYLKKAIQTDSTIGHPYIMLGLVYRETNRFEEAEAYLKKAMQLDSTDAYAYINFGLLYKNTRRYEKAEAYFKKAIQLDSTNNQAYTDFGLLCYRTRRFEEAEKYHKKAIQLDSTFAGAYVNLGITYADTYRYEEAEKYYKKAIQLDSTNNYTYYNLGLLYQRTRRNEEAVNYYQKAIQLDSTFAPSYGNLGLIYLNSRRYEKAEKQFKNAIKADSTYAPPYYNLGVIYLNTSRNEEAVNYYNKTIQLDSTYAKAYDNLGVIYQNSHRYEEAEKYHKKAIQFDSTNAITYGNLGSVYVATRRYEEAEPYLKKSMQFDSTLWIAYVNLGVSYQNLGRWEASVPMMKKAIQYGPPIGALVALLANSYTHIPDRLEDAKSELDKALQMDANWPDTYIYLAQWSLKMNQADQAWQYLEQGLIKGIGNGALKMDDLQHEPDFEEMRKDARWGELMKKYFPEKR